MTATETRGHDGHLGPADTAVDMTTAPILATSKNWASSRPAPAQPDAVRMGFGSST